MTDEANPSVEPTESPDVQPLMGGELLRQARESCGVSIEVLASTLKVPLPKLQALENCQYAQLGDPVFLRALASSACRYLQVDAVPVLAALPAARRSAPLEATRHPASAVAFPEPEGGPFTVSRSRISQQRQRQMPRMWWLLPVMAAVGLGAWWVQGQHLFDQPSAPAPALNSVALPAVPSPALPAAPVAPSPVVSGMVGGNPPVESSPAAAAGVVQIEARESVWTQVTGASGHVLLQRSLQAGEQVAFSEDLPLTVMLGRADAVQVRLRGQYFDLTPFTRNNVAQFDIR